MSIPKIIHQIWIGPHPAPVELMETWKKFHPDWEYKLWTDEKADWINQDKIDAMPEWNGKADIMRYEILLREGGVFLDADSECVKRLDDSFLEHDAWTCWESEIARPGLVACGYMATRPDHHLMYMCVKEISKSKLEGRAWESVGPKFFTEQIKNTKSDIHIFPSKMFIPKHFTGISSPALEDTPVYALQHWGSTVGYNNIMQSSSLKSGFGQWNDAYKNVGSLQPYGDVTTYQKGAEFLKDLNIEDWGCGMGWMRKYIPIHLYTGLDGSHTPYADKIIDLCTYTSETPGLFMRHVLEHNERHESILMNAVNSFKEKMVLIMFTPFQEETKKLATHEFTPGIFIPDFGFKKEDLTKHFKKYLVNEEDLKTNTQYGQEHIFYLSK